MSPIDWWSMPADVRAEDDVGQAEQRVARLGRLVVEHVEPGAGEMARDQAVAEVGLDDQAARATC